MIFRNLSIRLKVVIVTICSVSALFFLDRFIFDYLFFKFPNEMEWDTSPWYNFLHKRNKLENILGEKIFLTGSSVALYSALPGKIQKKLHESYNFQANVDFYSHVAMSPTDFYYYSNDIIKLRPSTVVYLLNPADFQFDSFQKNDGKLNFKNGELSYSEEVRISSYVYRYPVRLIYPGSFILENYNYLNKKEILYLLPRASLKVNTYRAFFLEPFEAFMEHHLKSGRSYHNYTGVIPEEGIYRKGWTKEEFTINCEINNGKLNESIFSQVPALHLYVYKGNELISEKFYQKIGWHKLDLLINSGDTNVKLKFKVDRSVSSRIVDEKLYGKEYFYGIRLSQNFCKKEIEHDIAYKRNPALEDDAFLNMSDEEYKKDFDERLFKDLDKRPELKRMQMVHNIKMELSKSKQFRKWSEFEFLEKAIEKFHKSGINLIIINNPEVSIELNNYINSPWYNGYLNYFKELELSQKIKFYNLNNYLKDDRYFSDFHHLTYHGAEVMSSEYADIIYKNIARNSNEK